MFNLAIDGPDANYFAEGVLVHNKSPPPLQTPRCVGGGVEITVHRDAEPDASMTAAFVDAGIEVSRGDYDVAWRSPPHDERLWIEIRTGAAWSNKDVIVTVASPTLHRIRLRTIEPGDYVVRAYGLLDVSEPPKSCSTSATRRFWIAAQPEADASTKDAADEHDD